MTCDTYYKAERLSHGQAVNRRQRSINQGYMRAARRIDNRNNGGGFTAENQGPFEKHLRTYGDGKNKCILGPVAGFFGGISDDLTEIIDMCVDQGSHVLFHAMGCHTLDQCRSTLLWQLRRDIGTASLKASADLILNRRRFLGGNWGKQLSRTRSAHARWFPNADVAFMDASRRNAGYGMDGHVDMMRALSVPSDASG